MLRLTLCYRNVSMNHALKDCSHELCSDVSSYLFLISNYIIVCLVLTIFSLPVSQEAGVSLLPCSQIGFPIQWLCCPMLWLSLGCLLTKRKKKILYAILMTSQQDIDGENILNQNSANCHMDWSNVLGHEGAGLRKEGFESMCVLAQMGYRGERRQVKHRSPQVTSVARG